MDNREGTNKADAQKSGKSGVDRRKFLGITAGGIGAAAAGAFLVGGGCKGSGNTIKIVSSLPRTGSAQGQTDTIVNGIKMAIEGAEIAGMKLEHRDMDDATAAQGQWDAGKEASNAREAAGDKDVMAFIGPYNSGASMVSQPILNEAGLIQVSPAATWPGLTKKVPGNSKDEPTIYRSTGNITFCRVCPTDFVQGPLSAVFAQKALNVKKVYILDDKELYGAGIAGLFENKCKELGIQVLGHDSIIPKQTNYKAVIQKIKSLQPELLYFGGTTQSSGPQIAIDMKGEGLNCPLMVPDGCYEQAFIEAAGADTLDKVNCFATIGGYDPGQMLAQGGTGAEFVKQYKDKFGKMPEAYAVYGYEAGKVVLEAIKKVGKKDRDAIRKEVLATKNFTAGALREKPKDGGEPRGWSFDEDGDTSIKVLTISKIQGGSFNPQQTIVE